jgi:nitrite reductase (NADH) small subunit
MSLVTPTHAIFDDWHEICGSDEIIIGTGMPARVLGRQLAIFNTDEGYFALGNCDPFSGANVLARGIIGDIGGKLVVASPVYKQHFCLRTGICLEDMSVTVPVWRVNVRNGRVFVCEGER